MAEILQILILGLALGGVYALMASGLTLIFGVMRIVNLAHPIFIIAGAFISYLAVQALRARPDPLDADRRHRALLRRRRPLQARLRARGGERQIFGDDGAPHLRARAVRRRAARLALLQHAARAPRRPTRTDAFFIGLGIFIPKGQLYAGIASLAVIGALFLFLRYTPLRLRDPRHDAEPRRRAADGRQCRLRLADHVRHRRRPRRRGRRAGQLRLLLLSGKALGVDRDPDVAGRARRHGQAASASSSPRCVLSVIAAFVGTYFGSTWSTLTFFLALFVILLVRPQGLFGDKIEES